MYQILIKPERKQKITYLDLGQIAYDEVWEKQTSLHKEVVKSKLNKRDSILQIRDHYLLFCEHNPVYTLGKSGRTENLLLKEPELAQRGIEFYKINRGGDITFHGPGQITGYPIFDLDLFFTDVHRYVRALEEVIILTLREFKITGIRLEGYTGVWIAPNKEGEKYRKICAIGVHLSRWVTMHGFALNVNTDLQYYNYIIPCGINDSNKSVTSIQNETGEKTDMDIVKQLLKKYFSLVFNFDYKE